MLNLLLVPTGDPAPVSDHVLRLQRTSHEQTAEELHQLSRLLEQRVRLAGALVDYAIAIADRPRFN